MEFRRATRYLPLTALQLDDSRTTNVTRIKWCIGEMEYRCVARALKQHNSMPNCVQRVDVVRPGLHFYETKGTAAARAVFIPATEAAPD